LIYLCGDNQVETLGTGINLHHKTRYIQ